MLVVASVLGACGHAPPQTPESAAAAAQPVVALPSAKAARNWDEFKRQAAQRMVAANPGVTYTGPVPEPLLAIPVLEVELNGDGSVRHVEVLRPPRQAKDTIQIAIEAVRRAAPYGDMRNLKKPWKFSEVFLFDDDRRFKPRTLDE
jgi:protein TonB